MLENIEHALNEINLTLYTIEQAIRQQKKEEQNVATWNKTYREYYQCSKCNTYAIDCYRFCPNCGAKMQGVVEK